MKIKSSLNTYPKKNRPIEGDKKNTNLQIHTDLNDKM